MNESRPTLVRGVGLLGAVAVNVISMIGIGPLITIPLVLGVAARAAFAGWMAARCVARHV